MRKSIFGLLAVLVVLTYEPPAVTAGPREDLVRRFYREVLERAPEPASSVAWANFLQANCNAQGFDSMSRGFLDSEEFRHDKPQSMKGLVSLMYRTFLGRDPDAADMEAWAQPFRAARLNVATEGFLGSQEFQSLLPDRTNRGAVIGVVRRFYTEVLGRDPEPAGMNAWADYIVRTRDLRSAAIGFLASQEFEAKPMTFRGYVTILYRAFLSREPDPAGLDAWEGVLRANMFSVIDAGFLPSKEFKQHETEVCAPGRSGFKAALVRCEDVNQPVALGSSCGKDPLEAGTAEIGGPPGEDDDQRSQVEVKVRGATSNTSYKVVFRSLSGATATELVLGTLATDANGDGTLEVDNAFAVGDIGSGSVVLERDTKDQFVTGFKVANEEDVELETALVRCEAVNQPITLDNCGTDPLKKGNAEIDEEGGVDVKVVHAVPRTSYRVVLRSLTGATATERVLGTLNTNPAGNGKLMLWNFFAPNDVGSGNVVLERDGKDQFVTGFRIVLPTADDEDDDEDMEDS